MMKPLTDITTAVALSCLAISSSAHADLAPLTTNDISTALWENAQRVCPEEFILYDQSVPDAQATLANSLDQSILDTQATTADQIPEHSIDEFWRAPGETPLDSEFMQMMLYMFVQAEQVNTLIEYLSDFHPDSEFSEQPYLDMRQRLQAETDLAKCLMPVGPRFPTPDEPELSARFHALFHNSPNPDVVIQSTHTVTQTVICAKWHEFSDRILTLDARELTQEVFEDTFNQISSETVGACETN